MDTVTTVLHVYLIFLTSFEVIWTPQNTSKLLRYYYEVNFRVHVFEVNLNLKVSVISYLPNDMTVLERV